MTGKRNGSGESPQAAKKQATALSSAAGAEAVPVEKPAETSPGTPPSSAAGSDAKIARPLLPTDKESTNCNVEALMTEICRWCEQELPAAIDKCPGLTGMRKNRPFWECSPLAIGVSDEGSLVGHKEPFCLLYTSDAADE